MFSSLISRRCVPFSRKALMKQSAGLRFGNCASSKQATTSILWRPEFVLLTGGFFSWVHMASSSQLIRTFDDEDLLFGGPDKGELAQIHIKYLTARWGLGIGSGLFTVFTAIGAWLEPERVARRRPQFATSLFPSRMGALCAVVGGSAFSILVKRYWPANDSFFGVALSLPNEIGIERDLWLRSMDRLDLNSEQRQALQSERWNTVIDAPFGTTIAYGFSLRVVFSNVLAYTNPYAAVGLYLGLIGSLLLIGETTSCVPVMELIHEFELCLLYMATGRLVVPVAIDCTTFVWDIAINHPSTLPFTVEGKGCAYVVKSR